MSGGIKQTQLLVELHGEPDDPETQSDEVTMSDKVKNMSQHEQSATVMQFLSEHMPQLREAGMSDEAILIGVFTFVIDGCLQLYGPEAAAKWLIGSGEEILEGAKGPTEPPVTH